MQPGEFLDWVAAVEEIIDFKRVLEDRQVSLVATKFRGRATTWWQKLKKIRVRQGKLKITSWEKLTKKIRPTFLPHNYLRTMYQRLQNWSQGSKFVDEYMEEFHKLLV
jgi:predicted thioredoxin/glutaredoxin